MVHLMQTSVNLGKLYEKFTFIFPRWCSGNIYSPCCSFEALHAVHNFTRAQRHLEYRKTSLDSTDNEPFESEIKISLAEIFA
jgi:hypothetical protein